MRTFTSHSATVPGNDGLGAMAAPRPGLPDKPDVGPAGGQGGRGRTGAARSAPQARLIPVGWLAVVVMTYLTRLTRTLFTESRLRASHKTMGTSGARLSTILMSSGSNL